MTKYTFDIPGFKGYQIDLVTHVIYNKFSSRVRLRQDNRGVWIVSITRTNGDRTVKKISDLVRLVIDKEVANNEITVNIRFKSMETYVYHLYTDGMSIEEGYVGVSKDPRRRLNDHKRKALGPMYEKFKKHTDIKMKMIYSSSDRYDCYLKEKELRPKANIGWNIAAGGPNSKSPYYKRFIIRENTLVGLPEHTGLPWTFDMNELLSQKWLENKYSLKDLSEEFKRTEKAIQTQLYKLKIFKRG